MSENTDLSKKYTPKQLEEAMKFIASGDFNIKQFYGLDNQSTEIIYNFGYQFFEQKKYDMAVKIFALLCFIEPKEEKYLHALSAASILDKNYQSAIMAYTALLAQGHIKPKYFYGLGDCALNLGQIDNAVNYFKSTIDFINKMGDDYKKEHKKLFDEASIRYEALSKKINNKTE